MMYIYFIFTHSLYNNIFFKILDSDEDIINNQVNQIIDAPDLANIEGTYPKLLRQKKAPSK